MVPLFVGVIGECREYQPSPIPFPSTGGNHEHIPQPSEVDPRLIEGGRYTDKGFSVEQTPQVFMRAVGDAVAIEIIGQNTPEVRVPSLGKRGGAEGFDGGEIVLGQAPYIGVTRRGIPLPGKITPAVVRILFGGEVTVRDGEGDDIDAVVRIRNPFDASACIL